jgi:hypothetical protein
VAYAPLPIWLVLGLYRAHCGQLEAGAASIKYLTCLVGSFVRTIVMRVMYGVHQQSQGTTTPPALPLCQLVHTGHPLHERRRQVEGGRALDEVGLNLAKAWPLSEGTIE